jgi:hypothetical protein
MESLGEIDTRLSDDLHFEALNDLDLERVDLCCLNLKVSLEEVKKWSQHLLQASKSTQRH